MSCEIPQVQPILPYTLTPTQIAFGEQLPEDKARVNRKVLAQFILSHEDEFYMDHWHGAPKRWRDLEKIAEYDIATETRAEARYACGTSHCIAGWAETLAPNRKDFFQSSRTNTVQIGQALLGLTNEEVDRTFFEDNTTAKKILKRWAADPIEVPPQPQAAP